MTRRDLGVSILLDTMYYQPAVGPAGILGYATLKGDGTPSQYPLEYVYTARIVDSQAPGAIIRAVPSAYLPPQFASEGPEPAMPITDVVLMVLAVDLSQSGSVGKFSWMQLLLTISSSFALLVISQYATNLFIFYLSR